VTVKPKNNISYFKKGIHTILVNSVFIRHGSNTMPTEEKLKEFSKLRNRNGIENNVSKQHQIHLDGVFDFMNFRHKDMVPKYKVFKELFVIAWPELQKKVRDKTFLSRVDIELINEQIKLFYQDVVTITYDEDTFTITEYLSLGLNDKTSYYP
jgi:hypothetical protein